MLIRTFLGFLLYLMAASTIAESRTLPDAVAMAFVELAQANFWGNAVGENGEILQLPNEGDPKAAIIPKEDALNVVNASVPVGQAISCGLGWNHYYLSFMNIEREKNRWSEAQIAFIGLLFGVSQNMISNALEGSCTPELKSQIQLQMRVHSDA